MSLKLVSVSPVVESWLFTVVSLSPASAVCRGNATFPRNFDPSAAAPRAAAPVMNLRRFKYVDFGVISDEGISACLPMSIRFLRGLLGRPLNIESFYIL